MPALLNYQGEPLKQYSVEIIDGKFGEKVVTAIEVLSPENKRPGDGMLQFQRKQKEYRDARVNRVGIDLLREGRRMFEFPERLIKPELHKLHYVTVHRGSSPGRAELYAIDLRDPLPVIKIPLRPIDPDLELVLQPIFSHVYQNGRFPIDYDEACDPPLEGEDAEWRARFWRRVRARLRNGFLFLADEGTRAGTAQHLQSFVQTSLFCLPVLPSATPCLPACHDACSRCCN